MESFKDITEKLKELGAKKLVGGETSKDKPKPVEPEQNQNPSTNDKKDDSEKKGESIQKINLAEASRDELIEFIKKQTVHVKKIEVRCVELFDAYKKVKKEKEALASETSKKSLEDEIQRLRQQLDSDNNNKEKSEENDNARQELEQQIKTLKEEAETTKSQFLTEKESMQKNFETEKTQFEQQVSELKLLLEQTKHAQQQEQTDLKTHLSQEQSLRQSSELQVSKLQEELNEFKKNMEELDAKYNEQSNNARVNELKMKDTIEEQLAKIKELESKVKKENLTSEDYNSEVEQEKQKLEESLLQLKKQLNESESSVLNLKSQLEEKTKSSDLEHQKLTHQLKTLKLEFEQEKQTLTSSHTLDKEKYENEKSQLTDQIQSLQQKLIELVHTNGELSNSLDTITKNISHNEAAVTQRHNEQIAQLKRQIEEFVTLKEEQTKAVGVISAEYQNAKDSLVASNTKIASLEQTIRLLEETHAKQIAEAVESSKPKEEAQSSNQAVGEIEQAMKQLQEERSMEHIQYMQTKEERDKLEKEIEQLREEQVVKQSEIEQLKRNEEQLKEAQTAELGAKDGHIAHLKKLLTVAQKQINDLKALAVEKKNQLTQVNEEMEALNKQVEEYKVIVNSIEENETKTKNIVAKYEQKIKQLENKIETLQHELNETNQEFNSYKIRAHTAIKQRESEQPKVNDQEDLIQELRKQLASQKKKIEELSSVHEEVYKYQQNAETLSQELSDCQKKNNDLSFKLERAVEDVKNKEQFWKNKVEKINQENQESFDRQAELHREVEEESAQRLQELNNLLKSARERHATTLETKEAEITKLKETNQKLQVEINHNKRRTLAITLPNADKTPALDTVINVANTSPTLVHKDQQQQQQLTSSPSFESLYTPRREGIPARGSEENLFYFTQIQQQRDDELAKLKLQVKDLSAALRDMEETENLHREQEKVLKGEIRELERAKKREGVNVDYVKAVVLNFLTSTEQQQSLLPVLGNLLQFSPEELLKVKEKYNEGFLDNVSKYWYGSPRKP